MAHDPHSHHDPNSVELPTPTAWPLISAFGIMLIFLGLVTTLVVTLVGSLTLLVAAIGWCKEVFPYPKHEAFPIRPEGEWPQVISPAGRTVTHLKTNSVPGHREQVPATAHSYSSGFFGGILGGFAMAAIACAWGLFVNGSIWYPINLLAAAGLPDLANASTETLKEFSLAGLVVALVTHFSTSILVGLLYTIILPMLPAKREWIFGGIVMPLIWTGLIWATLRFINPALNDRFEWLPFVLSQIAFGVVCGFYVYRSSRMSTMRDWSISRRLGVEAQHPDEDQES